LAEQFQKVSVPKAVRFWNHCADCLRTVEGVWWYPGSWV